ncbi:hypothetical protein QBC38DRAFT_478383 [Podospora fimiseda]|uniref:Secreted protein n=1 Tax=Podospora fimiseda TaxID=252190 RepID=A0AAN7BPC7_9PEZI|nr:hypothetical protein QBC38DRAFT_478383 [Podospora fimiseda]
MCSVFYGQYDIYVCLVCFCHLLGMGSVTGDHPVIQVRLSTVQEGFPNLRLASSDVFLCWSSLGQGKGRGESGNRNLSMSHW